MSKVACMEILVSPSSSRTVLCRSLDRTRLSPGEILLHEMCLILSKAVNE
jgi:hypothetical protein